MIVSGSSTYISLEYYSVAVLMTYIVSSPSKKK